MKKVKKTSNGTYEVQQYELHCITREVFATSPAEAVELVQSGEGEAGELEYIEVAELYGENGIRQITTPAGDVLTDCKLINAMKALQ